MKRLFWLGLGLAAGALVVRAVSKRAQAFTPRGIATGVGSSAGHLLESVRGFVDDVKDGMHEREAQIHAAFAEGVTFDEAEFDVDPDEYYLREGKQP